MGDNHLGILCGGHSYVTCRNGYCDGNNDRVGKYIFTILATLILSVKENYERESGCIFLECCALLHLAME